jgi:DNA-binding NtrC family response regulator
MNKTTAGTAQANNSKVNQSNKPERILVVDDCEGIRKIIFDILTEAGYECRTAGSGCEALAQLESGERFDLMLCDLLNTPHGVNLLHRTKQNYPNMPVIISTAPSCLGTVRFAVSRMDASSFLLKPFHSKALLTMIWSTLAGRSVEDATVSEA